MSLAEMLLEMDVPSTRRTLTRENIHWLLRNLGVRNKNHPNYNKVMGCLKASSVLGG